MRFLLFYHDTIYMPVERAEMNRKTRRRHIGRQEPSPPRLRGPTALKTLPTHDGQAHADKS